MTATTDGPTFATEYDAGGWDVVVVDAPSVGLPAEVRSRVLDRVSAVEPLIFSWWQLDSDADLATALGVSTTTFNDPKPVFPTAGASVDFFTSTEVIPAPLTATDDAGDNGDTLTLLGPGEIVCSADDPTGDGIVAITNGGKTIVLGFLPFDVQSTNNDADGRLDIVEFMTNLLLYF